MTYETKYVPFFFFINVAHADDCFFMSEFMTQAFYIYFFGPGLLLANLLFLGNWLTKLKSGGSSWADNNSVFNIVKFLAKSRTADLHTTVLHGGLGNIHQLLGNSLGQGKLGHWNVSYSGDTGKHLVVHVAHLNNVENYGACKEIFFIEKKRMQQQSKIHKNNFYKLIIQISLSIVKAL